MFELIAGQMAASAVQGGAHSWIVCHEPHHRVRFGLKPIHSAYIVCTLHVCTTNVAWSGTC